MTPFPPLVRRKKSLPEDGGHSNNIQDAQEARSSEAASLLQAGSVPVFHKSQGKFGILFKRFNKQEAQVLRKIV
jgi:hypothetical protein